MATQRFRKPKINTTGKVRSDKRERARVDIER